MDDNQLLVDIFLLKQKLGRRKKLRELLASVSRSEKYARACFRKAPTGPNRDKVGQAMQARAALCMLIEDEVGMRVAMANIRHFDKTGTLPE